MVTVVVVVMATVVVVIVVVMEVVILEVVAEVKEVVVLALMPVIALVEAVVVTVGLKDLVGAGEVVDTLVGVLAFNALIKVVNAVGFTLWFALPVLCSVYVLSDGAIDLSMDTLVMTAPSEGFGCGAAFDCRPMAALNCDPVLQAWMPPYQV